MSILKFKIRLLNKNRAFGLIEVMIAATILALGLLGVASIQSRSINSTKEFTIRENAIKFINNIIGFIYVMNDDEFGTLFSSSNNNCLNNYCSRSDFLQNIFTQWKASIQNALPNGKGCFCVVPATANNTTVKIRAAIKWTNLSGVSKTEYVDNIFFIKNFTVNNANYCSSNICNF